MVKYKIGIGLPLATDGFTSQILAQLSKVTIIIGFPLVTNGKLPL
jgi:hypothetical protein